jgi:hypothetical protein
VWLVEIVMPKSLMSDIKTGSIEMEDQDIDLEELDNAYEQDLDKQETQSDAKQKMHNKTSNKTSSPFPLLEGLQYRDLEGMMKPTIHVDEFSGKMGDDEDIIVLSFFVRDKQAAKDLVAWFEKGYDFVLDADRSPGEIKPSRYLVYVEMRRRSAAPQYVAELIDDLETLTEHESEDWTMRYDGRTQPFSEEAFAQTVPLTPDDYRKTHESDLNEWRTAAGLPVKTIHETKPDMRALQAAAGLI